MRTSDPDEADLPPVLAGIFAVFRLWANHPLALFGLLLVLNSLTRPYLGIYHDAMLYAGQVLTQLEPETYADDLFFRYGSQDRYSVFSALVAPLAAALGIELTFFLLYALSLLAWIAGSQRLTLRLLPAEAAVPALIYLVARGPEYGGTGALHVHEPFLTPRMMVFALAVWGLDAMLRARPAVAILLLAGSLMLHPLMAMPAVLLALGLAAARRWGLRPVLGLGGSLFLAAVTAFAVLPAGVWPGPLYDPEWEEAVVVSSPHLLARYWPARDWGRGATQVVLVAMAAALGFVRDGHGRSYLALTAFLGGAGALLGWYVCLFPYAVPIMAQPYRALWLVSWAVGAAGFALAVWGFRQPGQLGRGLGLALAFALGLNSWARLELIVPSLAAAVVGYALWLRARDRATGEWAIRMLLVAGLLGFGLAFGLVVVKALQRIDQSLEIATGMEAYADVMEYSSAWLWIAVALAFGAWAGDRLGRGACRAGLVILGGILLGLAYLLPTLPTLPTYGEHASGPAASLPFVREVIRAHADPGPVTVYSNLNRLNFVWIDLHAGCYFDWFQTAGLMFNRGTALEARRRARLVAPFEIARMKQHWENVHPWRRKVTFRFFELPEDGPVPAADADALRRLCDDAILDFVVLTAVDLPEDVLASDGRVRVYDARAIRRKAGDLKTP